jgi:RND family efflux transporter MFP subunit
MVLGNAPRLCSMLVAGALVGLGLAACGTKAAQDVQVARVGSGTIIGKPGGLGTAAAAVAVQVSVDVHDQITQVMVRTGDHVTKGQPLFGLDPIPLQVLGATLANRLQVLQADLTIQQGELAVAQAKGSPLAPGIQARIQSDQAQIALTQQLIAIAQGRSATVTAPLDGEVAAVNIAPGQRVSPGASLVAIVDFAQIEVTANLPIAEERNVTEGAFAELTFPTLPDLTLPAVVRSIPPSASNNGLTFQVVVDATNTPDKRVRPGLQSYARVTVTHIAKLVVNKLGVLNIDQDPSVFVIDGQTAHRHKVQVGLGDETHYEILSGLSAGDRVVIVGAQALDDGTPVRITKDEGA